MPWEKGQSGNPGGRPRESEELKRLILENSKNGRLLVEILFDFLHHASLERDRLAAAKLLLEYGFGRPIQSMNLAGAEGEPVKIIVNTGVIQPERPLSVANV